MKAKSKKNIKSIELPIFKPNFLKKYNKSIIFKHESALKGYLKTFRINGKNGWDSKSFLKENTNIIIKFIESQKKKPMKLKLILTCEYKKIKNEGPNKIEVVSFSDAFFHSKVLIITKTSNLKKIYESVIEDLLEKVQKFESKGSGWIFKGVKFFDISMNPFEPLGGSSFISLPDFIAHKKAIINVKNEKDNFCFKWAITSAVYPILKDGQRLSKIIKRNSEKFNWKGIQFPTPLNEIDRFEKNNRLMFLVVEKMKRFIL